ncbi:synaptotagmin-15 isoform X2 [Patella vulgata]|uniref:synaptotagmin-15 isoform X2 n=1 Tax=Patella vulgata TaxID=6465 RepID=UPI0024A99085|nr:synaptotagmin-15 isoform X2 [Patella vulgata]
MTTLTVPPAEVAGIITGAVTVVILATVVAILCWRFPTCRSRTFWDKSIKKVLRKLYGKCKKQPKKEEKKHLIFGPLIRKRSRDEPPFVVPQIFVDYGSRRTSYASASDHVMLGALALDLRRSSGSSCGSRRTSCSSDVDRRGSGSSLCSRRTSYGSDYDRRGSGSSICSRRTSLISDPSDRRGSGASSRSSRKGSDGSRFDDTDVSFADFSDSETLEAEEMAREHGMRGSIAGITVGGVGRRISVDAAALEGRQVPPYRRSHSLAELKKPLRPIPYEGRPKVTDQRRSTLSSLVSSSIQAFDQTGAAVPQTYLKKKNRRSPGIGLPDTPVALHDLNLDELVPRYAPPVSPTGKLKVQLQFTDDKHAITVIIIEAQNLIIPGIPKDVDVNPYVKAFLVPGRAVKYRTKTFSKTKNPLFLEKFCIKDIVPSEINEDSAIEFQVYSSHHVSRRHLVGVGSVRLMDVENLSTGQVDLTLYPQTVYRLHQGDLRISGCYQPVAGKIVFNVLEGRNLPRVSLLGAINPYVKVEMYVNGIRETKHKTKVRQNTQDPVWHHQCVFDINRENPKLLGHVFVFHVLHKDMMTGVHKIGQVDLGWYSHGEQLEHWYEIMEHPHRATDYWHPIIKTNKITS